MSTSTTDFPGHTHPMIINQLLALLGCPTLCSFFVDFNLPSEIICAPMRIQHFADFYLTKISKLQGDFWDVSKQNNEVFQEFLLALGSVYSSKTMNLFINWMKRHGIDHNNHVRLLVWHEILSMFDGWAARDSRATKREQILMDGFATYQRLLLSNEELKFSWIEEKLLTIQIRLECNQSLGILEHFLKHYIGSQPMDFIEVRIFMIERAYRFLSALKQYCGDPEQHQFILCATLLGTKSAFPPEHISLLSQLS